jgi:hypothetical protein
MPWGFAGNADKPDSKFQIPDFKKDPGLFHCLKFEVKRSMSWQHSSAKSAVRRKKDAASPESARLAEQRRVSRSRNKYSSQYTVNSGQFRADPCFKL